MEKNSKQLGNWGEEKATKYLKDKGYKILSRNWRNKLGEIDIICRKRKALVFVEVKTIQQAQGFFAEDEINWKKQRQLIKMAQSYLTDNKLDLDVAHQIDIVAIEVVGQGSDDYKLSHFENAIEDNY